MLCKIVCNFKKKKKSNLTKNWWMVKRVSNNGSKIPLYAMLTESTFNENMKVSNIKQIWVKKEFY